MNGLNKTLDKEKTKLKEKIGIVRNINTNQNMIMQI